MKKFFSILLSIIFALVLLVTFLFNIVRVNVTPSKIMDLGASMVNALAMIQNNDTGLFYTGVEFYLFDGSGAMVKGGWAKVDGYWYYASSNGRLYTGERTINGKKYWFTGSGIWVK